MGICFSAADILLPDFDKVDTLRWAVIACDQYTSQPEYWEKVKKLVGGAPSTLGLILPEVYLPAEPDRVAQIHDAMELYERSLLRGFEDAMLYVERTQPDGRVRRGLVGKVDLEAYDFHKGAGTPIRATEATVLERIPPRMAVRRDAALELPHVMLLMNDPTDGIFRELSRGEGEWLYDFDLMLDAGHVRGRLLSGEEKERVTAAMSALGGEDGFLFAVGDGNHSLATAKACYEELKETLGAEAAADHPARYALAEVVNLHDKALDFEPIYRVMFGVEPPAVFAELADYAAALSGGEAPQSVTCLYAGERRTLSFAHPSCPLTVGTLQEFIDGYLSRHGEASVDYIHGERALHELSAREDALGFLFTGMRKEELFPAVAAGGALPRKTFSMGHADDKRFYLECRKIK